MTRKSEATAEEQAAVLREIAAHYDEIVRAVRRVATGNADDLMVDAIDRAVTNADHFDGRNVVGWVTVLARRVQIDQARRRVTERRVLETHGRQVPAEAVGADEEALAGLADPALAEAVAALRPEDRAVLEAVVFDGLKYREAADRLGLPIGTVMSRLNRAKGALRVAITA